MKIINFKRRFEMIWGDEIEEILSYPALNNMSMEFNMLRTINLVENEFSNVSYSREIINFTVDFYFYGHYND